VIQVSTALAPAGVDAPTWRQRHLLDVDALDPDSVARCLDLAVQMRSLRERRERLNLLSGHVVGLAFAEASTRTRVSFEIAAASLGAEVVELPIGASSVSKGESLIDTIRTLERTGVGTIVMRHARSGAPYLAARSAGARIVNAGDGTHAHPTQALLDALTLREALGGLDGRTVAIVGDIGHSRVARSNLIAFQTMGAEVTVCGPPTLIPRGIEELGCEVSHSLDRLGEADVVYALRLQRERMAESFVPSVREYAAHFQIDSRRLGPRQLLMHPGPVNRGVELSGEAIDSPQSLMTEQVASGLVVRMAILYELLAARSDHPAPASGDSTTSPTPIGQPA